MSWSWLARRGRSAAFALLCTILGLLYSLARVPETLRANFGDFSPKNQTGLMTIDEAKGFCQTLNMPVWPERDQRRKVYDLTLINTELDWLEIRLNELWDHIDYFVIVEATRTFTNKPKALHLHDSILRFKPFYSKMIYSILDIEKMKVDYDAMNRFKERETFQRESNFDLELPRLIGEQELQVGDVLLISGKYLPFL